MKIKSTITGLLATLLLTTCAHFTSQSKWPLMAFTYSERLQLVQQMQFIDVNQVNNYQVVVEVKPQYFALMVLSHSGRRLGKFVQENENFELASSKPLSDKKLVLIVSALQQILFTDSSLEKTLRPQGWSVNDQGEHRKISYQGQNYAEIVYNGESRLNGTIHYQFHNKTEMIFTSRQLSND